MTTLEREIRAEKKLSSELAQYAGKWVAVRHHAVIVHGATLDEILDQIEEEDAHTTDGIFQVPESGVACYF
jgi:ribulose-5-phosphate 4-epimerase/fuculose-1-phosphate aldolase